MKWASRILERVGRSYGLRWPTRRFRRFVFNELRRYCSNELREVWTKEGYYMRVSPHDLLGTSIYFFGEYDLPLTTFMKEHIPEGAICWDVGAGAGWFALLMGKLVGPLGSVDTFEASAIHYQTVRANVELNGFSWVKSHHVAVGGKSGVGLYRPIKAAGKLNSDLTNSALGYLDWAAVAGKEEGGQSVSVVTLDEHADRVSQGRLDFVKLDIEGSEVAALRGGRESITRFRPVLAVEYNRDALERCGDSVQALDEEIKGLNYSQYVWNDGLKILDGAHRERLLDTQGSFNAYALPNRSRSL